MNADSDGQPTRIRRYLAASTFGARPGAARLVSRLHRDKRATALFRRRRTEKEMPRAFRVRDDADMGKHPAARVGGNYMADSATSQVTARSADCPMAVLMATSPWLASVACVKTAAVYQRPSGYSMTPTSLR